MSDTIRQTDGIASNPEIGATHGRKSADNGKLVYVIHSIASTNL